MNRRTFVLLGGTALLLPARRTQPSTPEQAGGRLRFTLDQRRRWSVWYQGADAPVPLIQDAELGAWIGDRLVTLADLEDITEGTRRPPGGEAIVLRGRTAAGVVLEAEFAWETGAAAAPRGSVTLRFFPDHALPSIRGVRFAEVPESAVIPGGAPLLALVNGYQSEDGCRIGRVGNSAPTLTSYAVCGLTRGQVGLGLAYDAQDPGEGRVRFDKSQMEAASEWQPGRPLFPQFDAGTLRICCDPAGDGASALRALLTPSSPVDIERLTAAVAPAGWSSRSELGTAVSEDSFIANLDLAAATFDRRQLRLIHLDDGYQKSAGDWEPNARFAHGHRWLTDRIHARGLQAGLWLAPFAVSEASGVPAAHPEWLVRQERAPLVLATRAAWGGRVFALDGGHAGVQEWLFELGRRVVRDWGYDCVTADLLEWACRGDAHAGGLTRAEAYRRGLASFRDGLGADTYLLGAAAPLQHAAGLVSGLRVGPDVAPTWGGIQRPARAAGLQAFYHRTTWINHGGALVARTPLQESEARAWVSLVALAGGAAMLGDDLTRLPPERLALLRRAIPAAPGGGRPIGAMREDADIAPAVTTAAGAVHPLTGTWRFRTGDDPAYAAAGFDDSVWETTQVPGGWEHTGRPDYAGFAWYRLRFTLPAGPAADGARVELGKFGDADEAFLNGVAIGRTGTFPPAATGDRDAYRRYTVPRDALVWGGENALAIRVFGGSGYWSTRRDRPADVWVMQGREGWWTVGLFNWDDAPRKIAVPLAAAGIRGARFQAFDVWGERALPEVTTSLEAEVPAHDVLIVSLRPTAAQRAQVLATSRHVVQGAVDVVEEEWNAETRTLRGRSVSLDGRAYGLTIAVPRGQVPGACTANIACTTRRLSGGHLVVEWPAGDPGTDLEWAVKFRAAARPAR